jgi:predicted transcriptional regulator
MSKPDSRQYVKKIEFIKRVFDGDAVLMFQHLIRQSKLSEQELYELRKMIDQKRKEMKIICLWNGFVISTRL